MKHPTEEQLVLFYYGEGRERPALEEHLAGCPACAAAYRDLERFLAHVQAPVPERGEEYPAQVWARLRPRLSEARPRPWLWKRWALAGAMATLLVAAFLAGRFWPVRQPPEPASAQARERILLVAVRDHLERSEMVLVELVNSGGDGGADISTEQRRAQELVPTSRLYRQTALRAGETSLASVLDDLERLLIEVAHSPSRLSAPELDGFRGRIDSGGLLFRIRILDSQVRSRQKAIWEGL